MPTQFDVEVHNEEALAALRRLERVVPNTAIEAANVAAEKAKARITHYPPELPGQTYVRTGVYGNGWSVSRIPRGWRLLGSAVQAGRNYTKYVSGDEHGLDQAAVHQGRWVRAHTAVADEIADIDVEMTPDIDAAIRAAGF